MDIVLRHQIERLLEKSSSDSMGQVLNELMVEFLTCKGFVVSDFVRDALLQTPRHTFLPGVDLRHAYRDQAVTTAQNDEGWFESSCSTPSIVCTMLEALDLSGAQNILELGAGTGYTSALMARCAPQAKIVTLEVLDDIAQSTAARLQEMGLSSIEVRSADGSDGSAGPGPYDRIVLACGASEIPTHLVSMLTEGGLIVIPIGSCVFVFEKRHGQLVGRPVIVATFIAYANGKPQSNWHKDGEKNVLWPHGIDSTSHRLGPPDHQTPGPGIHSEQIASWLLWTSLTYPHAILTMAEKDRGWGFGLHDEKTASTVLCRMAGELPFRHYGNRVEETIFECWGDVEVSEKFLEISETLADLGWPHFERLVITVEDRKETAIPLEANEFSVGEHVWRIEISGFEVLNSEVAPMTQEASCPTGVNEEYVLTGADDRSID